MFSVCARIPPAISEKLGPKSKTLTDMVTSFNEKNASSMKMFHAPGTASVPARSAGTSGPVSTGPRTMRRPIFVPPDAPLDTSRQVIPSVELKMDEFEAAHTCLAPTCSIHTHTN